MEPPPTVTVEPEISTAFIRVEEKLSGFLLAHRVAYNLAISGVLVLFAGFASGMTVGLFAMDSIQVKVLQEEGTQTERQNAMAIQKVLSQRHRLLVTLLLANAVAMEALPLFLNKTMPEWCAVLTSVTAILLFGEILPQALCTGRLQIPIVMRSLPLICFLMDALFIFAWPIARLLDFILGKHNEQTLYARSHLKALIRLHRRHPVLDEQPCVGLQMEEAALGDDEVVVIEGALDLATKTVGEVMVPIQGVYMLEWNTVVTPELRHEILEKGHSRIPVYKKHRNNVKGLLLVKSLIVLDAWNQPYVGDLVRATRPPIFCLPNLQLYDLLNEFQRGRHMAFITTNPEVHKRIWGREGESCPPDYFKLLGVATLEDVIEELIQEEIYDEFDHYTSTTNFVESVDLRLPIGKRASACRDPASNEDLVLLAPARTTLRTTKKTSARLSQFNSRRQSQLTDLQKRLIEDVSSPASGTSQNGDDNTPGIVVCRSPSSSHVVLMGRNSNQQPSDATYATDVDCKFHLDDEEPNKQQPRWSSRGLKNILGITAAKQQSGRRP